MPFDADAYLSSEGPGRRFVALGKGQTLFCQGDPADCVYYLHRGRVKISVVSTDGKEATLRLVSAGEFVGEKAMEKEPVSRVTTATAIAAVSALRMDREEFLQVMQTEHAFAYKFSSFLLACTMRTQADLVDQIFNRAEKRLARLLLLLAENTQQTGEDVLIPPISQEALASMIGCTRPRVNTFMNHFRKLGYIEYNQRIRVHRSLLNVFLRD